MKKYKELAITQMLVAPRQLPRLLDACLWATRDQDGSHRPELAEELLDILEAEGYATKADATSSGKSTYFIGTECRHGHRAPRFVSTGTCTECNRQRARHVSDARSALAAEQRAGRAARPVKVTAQIRCYPEDLQALRDYAAALAAARELSA